MQETWLKQSKLSEQQYEELKMISKAQSGDREAFKQIILTYQQRIYALAFRIIGNSDDAKDVAQEVFIRIYRFLPNFQNKNRFFTWVYRIVVNACYDHLKKQKRFHAYPIEQIPENKLPQVCQSHTQKEIFDQVIALLNHLSIPQKTAFLLRETEGFTCREIADIMQRPNSTIRSHLRNARIRLRDLLKQHYPEFFEG